MELMEQHLLAEIMFVVLLLEEHFQVDVFVVWLRMEIRILLVAVTFAGVVWELLTHLLNIMLEDGVVLEVLEVVGGLIEEIQEMLDTLGVAALLVVEQLQEIQEMLGQMVVQEQEQLLEIQEIQEGL